MCGIVGFCGEFDPGSLRAGLGRISHRGPDDSGVFIDSPAGVGLGHVRLSILDPSPLGHQPMLSEDGKVVLVFNGEIYNFRELRSELKGSGYRFRGSSDTEVLLNLYLNEGAAMLPRLNGIFTFAIWDARIRSLLVARDGLGVKPLYYAATSCGFGFSSEIKGLLAMMQDVGPIDELALHRYLSFLWCPGDGTPLKSVRKLLPGEAMLVSSGQVMRRWTWYRLPVSRGHIEYLGMSDSLDRLVSCLRQAVQRQLVADVPVGAFLSGGLDSSAIVALARETNPNIHCFTIDPVGDQEEGITDDLPYARKVANHLGVPLDIVRIEPGRMADDLTQMVLQLDEPLADPAPLNVLYIAELARERGVKVLLSGAGGDDLFSGYRRHRAVHLDAYWQWLPRGFRSLLERWTSGLDQRRAWKRRLTKLLSGAALDGDARIANYFMWAREQSLISLYTRDFAEHLTDSFATAPLLEFLESLPGDVSPLERTLALEQRFFLSDHNLIYTDKMSMAAGVEVRVPFLDMDLVDFAARVPSVLKQRGRISKWILKKAMEPYLPRPVIYRAKSGFGAPIRRWMRFELRHLLGDLLSEASLRRRGLFDPWAVQQLIRANDSGQVDGSYTLLSLLCIEIWLRAFVDDFSTVKH
ncbi:asparagine synthase (glutamine-hydrolyzing) [Imhoffiella purpurea]|uniref:asparagine synthase (glutamine-hydrolyzing) n=1 Tax=Imhoffiella purpurea TaxID=1249627 RepID=W9VMN8_9GAMM|nr:asparagine synthase (glutamine-hydrolyzing) [Imhoffiella purpurea]EXJ11775.1 Asparagine synthetase [Imhoffiella purpurea]